MAKANAKDVHPVFTLICDFVKTLIGPDKVKIKAIDEAADSIKAETDSFVRTRNYTDWNRDQLAANSAKVERLADQPGYGFTYSTMQGRRIDDIIFAALEHISEFVIPPTPQKNGKMNSHTRERRAWRLSLGFVRRAVENGKGERVYSSDRWSQFREELEELIPERFEGTKQNLTALQMVTLIAPSRLNSKRVSMNVYRPNRPDSTKNDYSQGEIEKFITDGFTFDISDETGEPIQETARYYWRRIVKKVTDAEQGEIEKPKKTRKPKAPEQQQAEAPAPVEQPAVNTETVVEEPLAQAS